MTSLMKNIESNDHTLNLIMDAIPDSNKKFIHRSFIEGGQEIKDIKTNK
jgi:hypothetical protein